MGILVRTLLVFCLAILVMAVFASGDEEGGHGGVAGLTFGDLGAGTESAAVE